MGEGHPRDKITEEAGPELFQILAEWRNRHGLTAFEYLYLMNVMTGRFVQAACVAEREGVKTPNGAPAG
jgi:hypothetical protein